MKDISFQQVAFILGYFLLKAKLDLGNQVCKPAITKIDPNI